MIKKIFIFIILTISLRSLCWYGFLPDNMKLSDAICIGAHHAEALDTRGWNIPVQYGTFYDLMAKHGARSLDIRLHLGTNEESVQGVVNDVGNFFGNLFTGKDPLKPREKPLALIGCHEHDKYNQNCYFTRLIEKRGKPDEFQVFLRDIKKFLDNNPSEAIFVTVGNYIYQELASDVNGWKGKTNADIAHFFDNLVRETGLLSRTLTEDIAKNTTVGDIRGKVAFFTNLDGVVAYSSTLRLPPPASQINHWDLVQNKCVLGNYNPNGVLTETVLQPENPFDTSTDQGFIKKLLDLIPDFLAENKRGEKLIWNYATEVNTVDNILNSAQCCDPNQKVNEISFNFLSKHESRSPLAIMYGINADRMRTLNDVYKTEGSQSLNKMLYDPTGGFQNYLQKIK